MASLTVGYSDTEDRVWVRLVSESSEQRIWLTRSRMLALIRTLANALETTLAELDSVLQIESAHRLAMEQEEAVSVMNGVSPPPAPKSKGYQVADGGLCTVFDVTIQDSRWVVQLHAASGQPLVFDGNRLQMHQLLKSLLNRQREADWRLYAPDWS